MINGWKRINRQIPEAEYIGVEGILGNQNMERV
jgi:hypothetical protein